MARKPKPEIVLRCSFCGKSQDEVDDLIAGPAVFICADCAGLAWEMVTEARTRRQQKGQQQP